MATRDSRPDEPGFVPFFRSYTKTWVHAVATAGLTAFGTLTFVHRWFAVLALASYVTPPLLLYWRKLRRHERAAVAADHGAEPDASADGRDARRREQPEAELRSDTGSDRARERESSTGPESRPESEPEPRVAAADEDATTERDRVAEDAAEPRPKTEAGIVDEADRTVEDADVTAEDAEGTARADWERVDVAIDGDSSDTNATAFSDVTVTETDAVYAVGAEGTVVADTGDSDGWTDVLEDGPDAQGNALRGVDATSDGEVVWVAGDNGAVGRIDAETGRHVDHTAPAGRTDNLAGVAVAGPGGDETILLINGSGEVLRGRYEDDVLDWDEPVKPGSGSSLVGIELAKDGGGGGSSTDGGVDVDEPVGYCCDTNDGVFETTDGGASFSRIGLDGADGTLEDVATTGRDDCLVSADDGVVHRYGGTAETWTPERVADAALTGIARRGDRTVVCTADGTVSERTSGATDWERADVDASEPLRAVSLGPTRTVAVGDGGTVLERSEEA